MIGAPSRRQRIGPLGSAAEIGDELPRRRRRLGLALMAVGALALASQGAGEWLLPYDPEALESVRRLTGWGALTAGGLVWAWALLCTLLLAALARSGPPPLALPALCGLALGASYVAAGGAPAALAMLLLVGVASLGWQSRQDGGAGLLLGCAVAVSVADAALSRYPTLWGAASVFSAMFIWIDRMHIQAGDQRLFTALAERDRLIASLDQRTDELTALQGARTRLLAGISHDLRQPLQAMRLFAEAMQATEPGRHGGRSDLLRQQMRATDDAVAMLDQFSEFSAIEQGALQSRPERVDLRELLDSLASNLQAAHPLSRLQMRVRGRHHAVETDRTQLARLVQNLAGNAVRYSLGLRTDRPARVLLGLRERSGDLLVDVVDNGRGIPPDKLDAVFEPYVQLPDGGSGASRGGRGLGLAIVRGLAVQLGLRLDPVVSQVGRGTRFRVVIPAALRRSGAAEPRPAAPAEPDPRLDGWLLALLEDEDAPRAALRAALEGVGATVIDAATLADLRLRLDACERFPDALVFDLDLGTGTLDGLAAVDRLRAEWEMTVPAVIVTGRVGALGSARLPERCAGLAKPVTLAVLAENLRRMVPQAGRLEPA